jgi:antitoxin CptB
MEHVILDPGFRRGDEQARDEGCRAILDTAPSPALTPALKLCYAMAMSSDLGMRRRRALWRATHRGTKEMDYLLGRYAERALDSMNAADIVLFERLIDTPDHEIEAAVLDGQSLGANDLDELIDRLRRFHGLDQG